MVFFKKMIDNFRCLWFDNTILICNLYHLLIVIGINHWVFFNLIVALLVWSNQAI